MQIRRRLVPEGPHFVTQCFDQPLPAAPRNVLLLDWTDRGTMHIRRFRRFSWLSMSRCLTFILLCIQCWFSPPSPGKHEIVNRHQDTQCLEWVVTKCGKGTYKS